MCSKEILEVHSGNILLGRPRRRWEDNVRKNIKEIDVNSSNLE